MDPYDWSDLDALVAPETDTAAASPTSVGLTPPAPDVPSLPVEGDSRSLRVSDSDLPPAQALAEIRRLTRQNAAAELHGYIGVLHDARTSGDVDFDDAIKAIPVLQKVVEHFEKLEAGQRGDVGGAVMNFSIVMPDGVRTFGMVQGVDRAVIDAQTGEVLAADPPPVTNDPRPSVVDLSDLRGWHD